MKIELYTEIEKLIAEGYSFEERSDSIFLMKDSVAVSFYFDGGQRWYKDGLYDRDDDLPAIIRPDGTQLWYRRGWLHRVDNKATVVHPNGKQEWSTRILF